MKTKTKFVISVKDLAPRKDPRGGMRHQAPSNNTRAIQPPNFGAATE